MLPRNRLIYFILIVLTIILGLTSRTSITPDIIYPYLGDLLYCVMFYFIIGFICPKWSPLRVCIASISFCFLIEFQQLIQTDFFLELRSTRLGRLTLGQGFLWSDLVAYALGAGLCFLGEYWYYNRK